MTAVAPAAAAVAACAKLSEVAPGIYQRAGRGEAPDRRNRGESAHAYALLAPDGWLLIDPGPGLASGRSLACGLRRIAGRPVVAVINTHPHPENVLANGAFPRARLVASRAAAATMAERCAQCLQRLRSAVGAAALAGTRPRVPDPAVDLLVDVPREVLLGGRLLHLLPLGTAHSPGDLAVLDPATATLFAGDAGRPSAVPDIADGSLAGAVAAYDTLIAAGNANGIERVLASHGAVTEPQGLAAPRDYLRALLQQAESAVQAGEPLFQPSLPPALASGRRNDVRHHQFNAQRAYREAESRWWDGGATAAVR